uniref:Uncharacterized protein n=1 Tax=Taiwanofungus camphoratus TaxID=2696576 RepID=A0A4D6SW89_TAICA|nr:hypothetical protein [Taiwanofungus camphoratus]QCG69980.1 hypothetical protein [Taiwanofungus camphoratus]UKQ56111.1 hypothetical protein [Taiwanofungus camphoratus]WRO45185.1 hypothetical protein [Taiwanofungus sp. YW-2023a]
MVEILLTISLIYNLGLLIEFSIEGLFSLVEGAPPLINDNILHMSDNRTNQGQLDNIPRNTEYKDPARLIRYITSNITALAIRRAAGRLTAVFIANASNVWIDIISNEARANYWIDQYNHYTQFGRLRGGQPGYGPFERDRGTNPLELPSDEANTNISNASSPSGGGIPEASKFIPDSPVDFFRDNFSPVDHSIPLDTLINVHIILILGLFFLVLGLIFLFIFLFINLLIIFNKNYFLERIKNKYVLMYAKYVIFKSRVDILFLGLFILGILCFILYILHYLIVHPIILR